LLGHHRDKPQGLRDHVQHAARGWRRRRRRQDPDHPGDRGRPAAARGVMQGNGSGPDRTAFVLTGGGSLGAVQVGMLYALLEAGVRPDLVVGSSVGALNGAYLAGHLSLDGVEDLAGLWESLKRTEIFPISPRRMVAGALRRRNHLFDPLGLRTLILRADLGFAHLEDAPIPLHV